MSKIIDNYLYLGVTTNFFDAGFRYKMSLIPSMKIQLGMLYPDFSYYNQRFSNIRFLFLIKVKTIKQWRNHAYIFDELMCIGLSIGLDSNHMSMIDRPTICLLSRGYLKDQT